MNKRDERLRELTERIRMLVPITSEPIDYARNTFETMLVLDVLVRVLGVSYRVDVTRSGIEVRSGEIVCKAETINDLAAALCEVIIELHEQPFTLAGPGFS